MLSGERRPRRVRAWYGLPGEIVIEEGHWHLVKVGPLPLPHPPLINRLIRGGLPVGERLRLSYLHELGHLQALPIALAHATWMWRRRRGARRRSPAVRAMGVAGILVGHQALWELAAEAYVVQKTGPGYRELYTKHANRCLLAFWVSMAGLALLGTVLPFMMESRHGP